MSKGSQNRLLIWILRDIKISSVSDLKLRERLMLVKQTTQNNYKRILWCDIYNVSVVADYALLPQASPSAKNITHSLTHSDVMKTTAGLRNVHWFTCQVAVENHQGLNVEGLILILRDIFLVFFLRWNFINISWLNMHTFLWIDQWDTCITEWGCTLTLTDTEWQIGGSLTRLRQHCEPCTRGAPCSADGLTPWTGMYCAITRLAQSMQ